MVFVEILTDIGITGAAASFVELAAICLVVYKLVDGAKAVVREVAAK